MTRKDRTLELLRRGWLTALGSAMGGGCMALSQRCGEFAREGWNVDRRWIPHAGGRHLAYRILGRLSK